jgi:hypothetical protein
MQTIIDALTHVPAAAYMALAASLLAALLTLTGVALSNRSSNQRLRIQLEHELAIKDRDLRRDRLEELYLIADSWTTTVLTHYLPYLQVMRGELTYNQALELTIEWGKDNAGNFKKAEMIVDFYFPELRPELNRVFEARDKANLVTATHKKRYKEGDFDGSEFVKPLIGGINNIEKMAVVLMSRIVEKARQAT